MGKDRLCRGEDKLREAIKGQKGDLIAKLMARLHGGDGESSGDGTDPPE